MPEYFYNSLKGTKRYKIDFIHTGGTNLRDYVRCRCDQQNSKQFFKGKEAG